MAERESRNVEQSELLESENILTGFFHVDKLVLRHSMSGTESWSPRLERFILHRPDAVCAVVYHKSRDTVFFVRQFRVGTFQKDHGWMTEFAAGLIDPGESPEQAVIREVREELGFQVDNPTLIRMMYTSPGIMNERVYLYFLEVDDADRVGDGGGNSHENEDLEIIEVKSDSLTAFAAEQEILDAKTIIGIQWCQLHRLGSP